ncbi:MAG: hypothetical protein JSU65_13840 [Candidatus Zixiibacteriota bacterium]|nr:MAG: hypothetical protein JSU65_13840 [candidate division Zixibacteria bacterium]
MSHKHYEGDIDLAIVIARPLYFALTTNVLVPFLLWAVCYWLNLNHEPANLVHSWQNVFFAIVASLALIQTALIFRWRNNAFKKPMIRSKESLEEDFSDNLLERSKPIFLAIAAMSLYGVMFFLITGELKETTVLVFYSFVVFQVVRPRYAFVRKLLRYQRNLVDSGQLLRD